LKSAANYGCPSIDDLQDLESNAGFERMHKFISPEGVRQDAAHIYLHPLLQDGAHPNLHLLLHSKVCRVLFDAQHRATGVEYVTAGTPCSAGLQSPTLKTVKAKRLVIISCGTFGSPAILERSGIGRRAHLEQLGIQTVSDLPGVGENYRDHPFIHFSYKASLPEKETLDWVLRDPAHMPKLMAEKNPVLGTNGLEIFGRWRPSTLEVEQMRNPRIAKLWAEEFVPHPSKPFMLTGSFAGYLGPPSDVPPGQYFTIGNYIPYPRSQGSVHITGKQVDAPLDISTGFFEGAGDIDLDLQVWTYKRTREVARRLDCYLGEVTVGHPQFATSSKAALVSLDSGSAGEAAQCGGPLKDIEYTSEDDEAIKACIRERIATAWHYLGSAPMRPREEGGVVDKDLHVYGVSKLMVAGELFLAFFSFLCSWEYFISISSRWCLLVLCYRQALGVETLTVPVPVGLIRLVDCSLQCRGKHVQHSSRYWRESGHNCRAGTGDRNRITPSCMLRSQVVNSVVALITSEWPANSTNRRRPLVSVRGKGRGEAGGQQATFPDVLKGCSV
jgi:choline dehydrogenase-like flavoprotein